MLDIVKHLGRNFLVRIVNGYFGKKVLYVLNKVLNTPLKVFIGFF